MARGLILETTFLVDLEREARRGAGNRATTFLDRYADAPLCITLTTAGEMASGTRMDGVDRWRSLIARFRVLVPDLSAAWQYGQVYRFLRDNGTLIGTNDLWIAATALAHDLPLVTRNVADFRRVPNLQIQEY